MSQKPTRTQLANTVISSAIEGGVFEHGDPTYRGFGCGISIPYSTADQYMDAAQSLYSEDKTVPLTYTLASFEKELASFVAPFVISKTAVDNAAVTAFMNEITSLPVVEHEVFRPISGITMTQATVPVTLGPFTIYSTSEHVSHIEKLVDGRLTSYLSEYPMAYVIGVKVMAREDARALELGDALFERFERTVRFMLGRSKSSFDVGILNYSGPSRNRAFVFNDEWGGSSTQRIGASTELAIDTPYLRKADIGFAAIWEMFNAGSLSEMKQRILLAIDWIGESYGEHALSSAFIKAAIALEILFNEQKSEPITKGITAQISESVALLLGHDLDSKLALEQQLKRLYGIRSSIAHAGKGDINPNDLDAIRDLARQCVIQVMVNPAFKDVHKASDMTLLFKRLKYGGAQAAPVDDLG